MRIINSTIYTFTIISLFNNCLLANDLRIDNETYFKKTTTEQIKRMWIDFYEDSQSKNQILIAYLSNATNGFDNQMDGKMNPMFTGSKMYSLIENLKDEYVIQGRALSTLDLDVVNIGYYAQNKAEYSFKLAKTDNFSNQSIYIYDTETNQLTDITERSYVFTSEVGYYNNRFKLIFSNKTIFEKNNWSLGYPTIEKEAIVRGDLTINDDLKADKFILESGSVILNATLSSNQVINNLSADKFIINGDGIYPQSIDAESKGLFTVIQNSSPMILNDATLWSSPVIGQNVRSFSYKTLLKRFYTYNEESNKFSSLFENDPLYPNKDIKDPSIYNFSKGIGYHIRVSSDQNSTVASVFEGKFIGELNNGNISVPVTKLNNGYNLVGNPYPSTINANKFFSLNPSITSLFFWTQEAPLTSNGYSANNYSSYTRAGGVKAASGGVAPSEIISKGQGFFVEVDKSSSIEFDNSLRTFPTDPVIMHKGEYPKKYWIDLFEGTQPKNQLLVSYLANASNGYDHQIDGKMNQMYLGSKLFTFLDDAEEQYVIQGRDLSKFENDIVKVGFEAKTKGIYTIKLSDVENLDNQSIFLKDKMDNQLIDLTKTAYTFNSDEGNFYERFELIYKFTTLNTTDLNKLNNDVTVVKTTSGIKVISTKELAKIEVYDISGRKISTSSAKGLQTLIIGLAKTNQILVIKVITKDGEIFSKKVSY